MSRQRREAETDVALGLRFVAPDALLAEPSDQWSALLAVAGQKRLAVLEGARVGSVERVALDECRSSLQVEVEGNEPADS